MSTLEVKVVKIEAILEHPNAERLEIAQIAGWQCVVGKGQYKTGDLAVYIPIDSILPQEVETKLFGPDAKVKLSKGRVKTIKLRGVISQGMLATFKVLELPTKPEGTDVTEALGITKFEPPKVHQGVGQMNPVPKKATNPDFRKYTSFEHFKKNNKLFKPEDQVVITEKLHGSNWRAGWVPFCASTTWKKIKKFLRLTPQYEFVYGSHNVQLQDKMTYNGYYKENVYSEMVVKYNIKALLKPGQVVYGEVYGNGIQKGYDYGCKAGERKLALFDLMEFGKYVDWDRLEEFCNTTGLPLVPVLHKGTFDPEQAAQLTVGNSVMVPTQKVREGIVIKSLKEEICYLGRKAVKFVSDEYLLKDNTDFH